MGYEYESCLDVVLWEKRTAALQGYELDASNMGGWTLDKHHILDIQNGERVVDRWIPDCKCGSAVIFFFFPVATQGTAGKKIPFST